MAWEDTAAALAAHAGFSPGNGEVWIDPVGDLYCARNEKGWTPECCRVDVRALIGGAVVSINISELRTWTLAILHSWTIGVVEDALDGEYPAVETNTITTLRKSDGTFAVSVAEAFTTADYSTRGEAVAAALVTALG